MAVVTQTVKGVAVLVTVLLLLLPTLAVASLISYVHKEAATTSMSFYVSPSGNDTNAGTSPSEAWLTLAAASQRLPAVNSSWTLLLERNGTWVNDPLVLPTVASGATAVAIGAYGDDIFAPRPSIVLARSMTGMRGTCVGLSHLAASSVHISDLHISGCSEGLVLASAANAVVSNVTITRNAFFDIRTPMLRYTPPNPQWANAMLLEGQFAGVTVSHNIAARIDVIFGSGGFIDGLHLDSNTVQQCSGNCYSFGQCTNLLMENSVALRDMSERLFMYGTTDVIVGSLSGFNAVINNDFNARGEYQGGPDGCAFDFETNATGFVVQGNTFYRSWGSGVMIFGHASTSQKLSIVENVFAYAGCVQNRDDRGGIAVMCPNFQKPSGNVSYNTFFTCPGVPAFFVNPDVPHCADDLTRVGNVIDGPHAMVEMPQVSFSPPSPASTDVVGLFSVLAVTTTPNATIRYTLDGSRPTEASPVMPETGILLPWPSSAVAVNARAFKTGMVPSVTNGAIVELNYVLGRMAPGGPLGPNGAVVGDLAGHLDSVDLSASPAVVSGWAVDTTLPKGGWGPVSVLVTIDNEPAVVSIARGDRPDLVTAGVAPNPAHGFGITLPAEADAQLRGPGRHVLVVSAIGTPAAMLPTPLPWASTFVVCDGKPCQ